MIVEVYEKNLEHGDVLSELNTGDRKEKNERENNVIYCVMLYELYIFKYKMVTIRYHMSLKIIHKVHQTAYDNKQLGKDESVHHLVY